MADTLDRYKLLLAFGPLAASAMPPPASRRNAQAKLAAEVAGRHLGINAGGAA